MSHQCHTSPEIPSPGQGEPTPALPHSPNEPDTQRPRPRRTCSHGPFARLKQASIGGVAATILALAPPMDGAQTQASEADDLPRHSCSAPGPSSLCAPEEQLQAALVLADRAEYTQAEALLRGLLSELQRRVDQNGKATAAAAWNDLGAVYMDQGKLIEAERSLRNSLRLYQEVRGREHPTLAYPLSSLGSVMQARHRLGDAEKLYREALRILENEVETNHMLLAKVLNNLGCLRIETGEYAAAEQMFLRGLRTLEGAPHAAWHVGAGMHYSFAELCRRRNQYGEAESHMRAALEIWRNSVGEAHPLYAQGLARLAAVLASRSQPEQAAALVQQALTTAEERLGPAHPVLAEILYTYCEVLKVGGRKREAKTYRKRAEAIRDAGANSNLQQHSVDVSEFRRR